LLLVAERTAAEDQKAVGRPPKRMAKKEEEKEEQQEQMVRRQKAERVARKQVEESQAEKMKDEEAEEEAVMKPRRTEAMADVTEAKEILRKAVIELERATAERMALPMASMQMLKPRATQAAAMAIKTLAGQMTGQLVATLPRPTSAVGNPVHRRMLTRVAGPEAAATVGTETQSLELATLAARGAAHVKGHLLWQALPRRVAPEAHGPQATLVGSHGADMARVELMPNAEALWSP